MSFLLPTGNKLNNLKKKLIHIENSTYYFINYIRNSKTVLSFEAWTLWQNLNAVTHMLEDVRAARNALQYGKKLLAFNGQRGQRVVIRSGLANSKNNRGHLTTRML